MTSLEENILKSEILLKIRVTLRKIKKLSHETFPTIGPQKVLLLSKRILEQIICRYKYPQTHDVCNLLIDSFRMKEDEIFETICRYSKSELFVNRIDNQEIKEACNRLQHNIIPNAMIKDGIENPIDIRNILFAIWLVSYKENEDDIQVFSDYIQHYNLLGIKGVELSIESTNEDEYSLVDEKKYIFNIGPKSSRILKDKDADYFIGK